MSPSIPDNASYRYRLILDPEDLFPSVFYDTVTPREAHNHPPDHDAAMDWAAREFRTALSNQATFAYLDLIYQSPNTPYEAQSICVLWPVGDQLIFRQLAGESTYSEILVKEPTP